jgi:peptidoglycan hydrolase-like protein with peptidoglycan-binding domain
MNILRLIAFAPIFAFLLPTHSFASGISKKDLLEAELRLSELGYWILKADGKADASTKQAIIAFQKVEGLKRTGVLTPGLLENIRFARRPLPRFEDGTSHIEIDITRQVLFLTSADNVVIKILPVSTGNEKRYLESGRWQIAHTPRGSFHITRKINGVRRAPLGDLFYPSYFYGGVAIHGSNSVPIIPASHGCVRIPRFADRAFSTMVSVGMPVYVFD